MSVIKVSKERYESPHYLIQSNPIGTPVVIDATKNGISGPTLRHINNICRTLGFQTPEILHCATRFNTEKELLEELRQLASAATNEKTSGTGSSRKIGFDEVFLCFIVGTGAPGHFNLYSKDDDTEPIEVEIDSVVSIFKGDRCQRLILKPKIFIVQTSNENLEKTDQAQHADRDEPPHRPCKIPIEADLLVYQSTFSDDYTRTLHKECGDFYKKLEEKKLVGEGESSHFIFTLEQALKSLPNEFEFNELMFTTNRMLKDFIEEDKNWKPRESNWNIEPSLPICCSQLTKKLHLQKVEV